MSSALHSACPVCGTAHVAAFGLFDGKGDWRCEIVARVLVFLTVPGP